MAYVVTKKLSNGKRAYLVRYRGPDRKRHSQQFARRVDAERFANGVETSKSNGTWIDPKRAKITVRAWIEKWQPSTVNLRPSAKARQDGIVRHHIDARFGDLPLSHVENADVQAWVAEMDTSGLAAATVAKNYKVFAKIMQAAVDDNRLPKNPAKPVRLPRDDDTEEMRFLSLSEVDALAAVIDPAYATWVLFMAYTGLRFGEAAALRWRNVNLLRRRIEVVEDVTHVAGRLHFGPTKTKAGKRGIPIPTALADALGELSARAAAPDAFVFTAKEGGVLRVDNFRARIWVPAVRKSGLGHVRLHDLRHTAIALWIEAGLGPKEVCVRAGHSNVAFTLQRYGHLYPEADDRMTDALDALTAKALKDAELRPNGPPSPFESSAR